MTNQGITAAGEMARRIRWLTSMRDRLPAEVLDVLLIMATYASKDHIAYPSDRTIADSTPALSTAMVEAARLDAVDLNLLRPVQHDQANAYRMNVGAIPDDQWPLFRTSLLGNIRKLPDITNRDQLVLEALVDIGYRWDSDTITVTLREIQQRLPRMAKWTFNRAIRSLRSLGYLEKFRRAYGRRGAEYRLILSPDRAAADTELVQKCTNLDTELVQKCTNLDTELVQKCTNSPGPSLMDNYQGEVPLSTPSGEPERESSRSSLFWAAVAAQDPTTAKKMVMVADLEQRGGRPWDPALAAELIEDLKEANEWAATPVGAVIAKWKAKAATEDLTKPPPEDSLPLPPPPAQLVIDHDGPVDCDVCEDTGIVATETKAGWVSQPVCPKCGRIAKEVQEWTT